MSICLASIYTASLRSDTPDFSECASRFDAKHYLQIASLGYQYDPNAASTVAFFPAYPLTISMLCHFGLDLSWSSIVASNLFCIAYLYVLYRYAEVCATQASLNSQEELDRFPVAVMLTAALIPTSFFLRVGYSEALFSLALAIFLLAIRVDANRWLVIILAGAITAVRPVGIAVVPAALLYFWRTMPWELPVRHRVWLTLNAAWVSAFGLIAFMVFQLAAFGEALAFASTQEHWLMHPNPSGLDKLLSLTSLEPFWGTYLRGNAYDWTRLSRGSHPLMSLQFANPLVFASAMIFIVIGTSKRWLTGYEIIVSALLLLIPYTTRAYEMTFNSHARFALVVIPVYIVSGHLVVRCHAAVGFVGISVSTLILAMYAYAFGQGRAFF
jgi:hypothetical protein